jgi:hypothetical protein
MTCGLVDWAASMDSVSRLRVFDKDNTLTQPYAPSVSSQTSLHFKQCQQVSKGTVVLFSNSAGSLYQ